MADFTEKFVKGSTNVITVQLSEDGAPIASNWTNLVIKIGEALTITRTASTDGVSLDVDDGELRIIPAQLTEDLSDLIIGHLYRVYIEVTDASNPEGAVWGADDSNSFIYFLVSEPV